MSDPELLKVALRFKDDGNAKFKAQKLKEAEGFYRDGLAHLDTVKNSNAEIETLKKTILTNLSVVTNNTGDFKDTLMNCTKALDIDEKHTKAYYLRAVARSKMNDWDEAMDDIKSAIKTAPSDKKLRDEFEVIKAGRTKYNKNSQAGFQKFFSEGIYNEKETPKVAKFESALPEFDIENPQTFFDITIGEEGEEGFQQGRVVFELFAKNTPLTAENFRCICTGEKDGLTYKDNIFHRIIPGFMMQGGDITNQNGTGGKSIYGNKFNDEGIWLPHTHGGILSMANSGPNTNGSQFFLCYGATPHLDQKHTVYGRVIHGYDIAQIAEQVETGQQDKPLKTVKIAECGELTGEAKLTAETADYLATYSKAPEGK